MYQFNLNFYNLFFTLFITITCIIISCNSINPTKTNFNKFIKKECDSTDYPQLCYMTLSPYASKINNSRQKLCYVALSVTLSATKNTSKIVTKVSKKDGPKLNKTEAGAIKDCIEEIGYSIDEIKQSLDEIKTYKKGFNSMYVRSNVITWVSAAITDEITCLDGLDEAHVRLTTKKKISPSVLRSLKLLSVTLSLLNRL
ncbi:hypothetical protein RND81_14G127100 [Saponaria officinalis]|uniref:Pectinesterase inhibitor domain-containing protein n=1 Tax=Saponaria officinalis TaxID=3572 RepID=A0AAW1GL29_SAPOF